MTKEQELKEQAIAIVRERFEAQREQVRMIEPRLEEYYEGLCKESSAVEGDEKDVHNVDEVLGAIKFLRLLRMYEFNHEKVREVIYDGEGEWRAVEGCRDQIAAHSTRWEHVRGGLKQPGRKGPQVYRWEPFQVFMLAAMYGPMAWIDTGNEVGMREMLDTERANEAGHIEDLRRLCVNFIAFMPRKTNKTGFSAITNCEDFMRGDADAQVFCAANAQQQSKILFQRTVDLIRQLDPQGKRIRFTATEVNWKPGQFRSAALYALSAGGKTKDGTFASRCSPDEFGSAGYVNGKSDMGALVKVIESSMGPRREPMTVITTTAGNIQQGPFMEILEATQKELAREVLYDSGKAEPTLEADRRMCLLLHPDAWELEEDVLLTQKHIRKKVNPMLGKIVQHSFYDQEVAAARIDPLSMQEVVAKLFNVYRGVSAVEWLKPEEVKRLQQPMRIDELRPINGQHWMIFTGLDFSLGDDFYAHGYLCFNPALPAPRRFFADLDSWMSREAVNSSTLRPLFEQWEEAGWLHVVEGATVPPEVSLKRIDQLVQSGCGVFAGFGFDPYASKIPINALKAYIYGLGADPEQIVQPCRQTLAAFNSSVDELGYMIKSSEPWITFSDSPLWPFEAGNMVLEIDPKMENKKPVKRAGSAGKIDNFIALLMGLQMFDLADGGGK